jgi:hypothetical protein
MLEISLENRRTLLTPSDLSKLLKTEMSHIQSPALLDMGDIKRVYFCSRVLSERSGTNFVSRIFFVDFDEHLRGIVNFSRGPVAELGELGCFDEHGTNPISLIEFQGRLHIYYVGWSRSVDVPYAANIGLLLSTSENGNSFDRVFSGPILPFDQDEPFLLGSPRVKEFSGMLYMWYVAGKSWNIIDGHPEPTYKIRMATSQDGLNWEKENRDLIKDSLGDLECQAAPEVFYINPGYLMVYSFRSNGRSGNNSDYQVNTAYSDDLLNWQVSSRETCASKISGMEDTSYYNVTKTAHNYTALFQLKGMGKIGIGTGSLVVKGNL